MSTKSKIFSKVLQKVAENPELASKLLEKSSEALPKILKAQQRLSSLSNVQQAVPPPKPPIKIFKIIRRTIQYGLLGSTIVGTGLSLHNANYDWSGIGIVRFTRSAMAVIEIATLYQRELFFKKWDKSSKEYRDQRSIVHQKAANRVLELCCLNRGVYVKVGQHMGALEYLLPIEYVNTMKILHSQAPANSLEEIYQVIRQDLKRDVSYTFF
jgi:hypothetical protein